MIRSLLAAAMAVSCSTAFAVDGLDLGSLKPKDPATATTPASTPIGMNPLKKPTDTTATGTTAGTIPGSKVNPLNKSLFGNAPAANGAAASSDSSNTSDDVKVKMPSNFKK